MNKYSTHTLAYLTDIDVNHIVDMHIAYHCDFEGKPKPSITKLKQKYQYMLHLIITKCRYNKDGICYLNAVFYRDHIFYDHFTDMVSTLSRLGIISLGDYIPQKHSTTICLMDWNINYRRVELREVGQCIEEVELYSQV